MSLMSVTFMCYSILAFDGRNANSSMVFSFLLFSKSQKCGFFVATKKGRSGERTDGIPPAGGGWRKIRRDTMIQTKYEERRIENIIPYENNPRRNDEAVKDVVASIRQCGNIDPIEVDEDGVILSGHTRLKALQELGYEKANVVVISGMTEKQKKKYRLLANKTGEKAGWDFEKLDIELDGMDFDGYDFGFVNADFGNIDDLFVDAGEKKEKEEKQIQCPHCKLWFTP